MIKQALQKAGWTPWEGGKCPVNPDSWPLVLEADGSIDCERASDFQWEWDDLYPACNIIAYKELS